MGYRCVQFHTGFRSSIFNYITKGKQSIAANNNCASHIAGGEIIVPIRINENSTIANDIVCIEHHPKESKIMVRLHKKRTCERPYLVGRLSGGILSMIQWEWQEKDENEEAYLVGTYKLPQSNNNNIYFIEIIVLTCTPIKHETNFKPICLKHPDHDRLTARDAFIDTGTTTIDTNSSSSSSSSVVGHWYHKNNVTAPVFTRYQPRECFQIEELHMTAKHIHREPTKTMEQLSFLMKYHRLGKFCHPFISISRFDPYVFRFNNEGLDLKNRLEGERGKVCFIGASHNELFSGFTHGLIQDAQNNQPTLATQHFWVNFTHSFSMETVATITRANCTKAVFGWGQWDLVFDYDPDGVKVRDPTLFSKYERDLVNAMSLMVEKLRPANIDLYFRNTHYNPLGLHKLECPPIDWRSPPVIDKYNEITKRLCEEFGIPLIDTRDIHAPFWDSASDWNHYRGIGGKMEATHILDRLFPRDDDDDVQKTQRS